MPEKRYTKVEEEIIQILDKMEDEKPAPSRPNLRLVPTKPRRSRRQWPNWRGLVSRAPWIWVAGALALAFLAILVRGTSDNLALGLAILSIAAFFAPIFLSRRPSATDGGGGGGETKTWRGRDITLHPPKGESLGDWWRRRRGGGPRF